MNHPNKEIMNKLIELTKEKKVVAAMIIKGEEIISTGINTVKKDINPINHAEMNAIKDAAKKLNSHKLEGCWLYTIFEPCPMCASACVWARMEGIVYGANMDDRNELILIWIKRLIEDGMENEIDQDEFVPPEIIDLLSNLHSELKELFKNPGSYWPALRKG